MGSGKTAFTICGVVCLLVVTIPLGITSIYLSQTQSDQCDYTDLMGLNIKQWLLGAGIASIITSVLIGTFRACSLCFDEVIWIPSCIFIFLHSCFATAWFIVGAIILFRSNIECIHEASIPVIYALVMWALAAIAT